MCFCYVFLIVEILYDVLFLTWTLGRLARELKKNPNKKSNQIKLKKQQQSFTPCPLAPLPPSPVPHPPLLPLSPPASSPPSPPLFSSNFFSCSSSAFSNTPSSNSFSNICVHRRTNLTHIFRVQALISVCCD